MANLIFELGGKLEEKIYQSSFKTTIGGQALIEGIMMRGPEEISIAVRNPDNEIIIKNQEINSLEKKYKFLSLPIIRGAYRLIEAMVIGTKALTYSASFYDEEEVGYLEKKYGEKGEKVATGLSVFASFIVAIVVFTLIPNLLATLIGKYVESTFVLNLIEGIVRIIIFLIYLEFTKKLEDIQRVFMYHGAEHKTIHCYENRLPLTVENVKKFPRMHPRCGTSFIFMVMVVSILVLSFFGWPNPVMRILIRILALPLIAGISYEINRVIGRSDSKIAKFFTKPGLFIQKHFTVLEPEDDQIEVAICALKEVIPKDGVSDLWK